MFSVVKKMKKIYIALFAVTIENLNNLNIKPIKKTGVLLFAVSAIMKMKNYLKNKNQQIYLKNLV